MPFRPHSSPLPLTPVAFEILLALSDRDLHGYAIIQELEPRLGSVIPLRTGTMYRALARLVESELIVEVEEPDPLADSRRRQYRITPRGREIARAEARRLADQVAAARARKLLSRNGR
jgi:DNA-binding PadR family transcriptional regulator